MNNFLPKETRDLFQPQHTKKAHLWYPIHYWSHLNEESLIKNRKNGDEKLNSTIQGALSKDLQEVGKKASQKRFSAIIHLENKECRTRVLSGKLHEPVIHGLGGGETGEVSITIHPIYGIPYIPGSSLKGVVRHWFIKAYFDGREKKFLDEDGQMAEIGRFVFGAENQKAAVQFHDILIYEKAQIRFDTMTPHFAKYYSGKEHAVPDGSEEPIPIPFYTILVPEVEIFFSVQIQKKYDPVLLGKVVAQWTEKALTQWGIGAKTSSGYGLFKKVTDVTEQKIEAKLAEIKAEKIKEMEQERRRQEEARRKAEEEARIAAMSPEEKLVYEIENLGESEQEIQQSKSTLFEKVIESGNVQAAKALRSYWQKTGNWKTKSSPKQRKKIERLKALLEDRSS